MLLDIALLWCGAACTVGAVWSAVAAIAKERGR